MNLGRLRARTLRERVILLLLPVLAFRLLFPAGFMPRFGDGLELSMQMCHGDAGSSAIIHALETPPATPDDGDGQHEAPCVFAALGTLATVEPPPPALAVAAPADILRQPAAPAPALRVTHRSQAPRAPPLTV
jgi:hypothetical protein